MSKIRYVCLVGEGRDQVWSEADVYRIIGERVMTGWPVVQTEIDARGQKLSAAWQLSFDGHVWCIYVQEI